MSAPIPQAAFRDGTQEGAKVKRPPYRKWTREENDRIAELYQKGASTKWIAQVFRVSRRSIESKLSLWGLERQNPYTPWSPEELRTLATMRSAGMSYDRIAKHLNRSKSSVRHQHDRMSAT